MRGLVVRVCAMVMSGPRAIALVWGAAFTVAGAVPAMAGAQQSATAAPSLVFDGVTVVDVEQGKLVPSQRVVIAGNRIQTVGNARAVSLPKGAQVVNAQGKFLIPGLWDMHLHYWAAADPLHFAYPLLLVNGVTGMREPASNILLDTLIKWRRDILAGKREGPPRQLFSGALINERRGCKRAAPADNNSHHCVIAGDSADAQKLVDSLRAAGADLIKMYDLSKEMYFIIAREARRLGVPFGGHIHDTDLSAVEASDSGAIVLDHANTAGWMEGVCWGDGATVDRCRPVAERFARNGTWWVPTLLRFVTIDHPELFRAAGQRSQPVFHRFQDRIRAFWEGSKLQGNWLRDSTGADASRVARESAIGAEDGDPDVVGGLFVAHRAGLPIVAGTDVETVVRWKMPPGFSLHGELAMYVAEGLTALEALRAATLNPAKMLRATDSLGTVAAGKLADLVLLDADPLADITNTTAIRAVVANGRYFDRAGLDQLLAEVQKEGRTAP